MTAVERVNKDFEDRFVQASSIIKSSGIRYKCVGIFGSYARGTHNAMSGIDFVIIPAEAPDIMGLSLCRSKLDKIKCQLALLSEDELVNPTTPFSVAVRRDIMILDGRENLKCL